MTISWNSITFVHNMRLNEKFQMLNNENETGIELTHQKPTWKVLTLEANLNALSPHFDFDLGNVYTLPPEILAVINQPPQHFNMVFNMFGPGEQPVTNPADQLPTPLSLAMKKSGA